MSSLRHSDLPGDFSWRGFRMRSLPTVAPWVEMLGRAGYVAKGVVYFIVGLLAFRLALGVGGEVADAREAIREIGQQPYGKLLLGLTAIGLLGYAVWRWVQAIKDTEGQGREAKGIVTRIGFAISGVIYLLLGSFAGSLSLGWGAGSGGGSGGSSSSLLLGSAWGRVILGIVGVIVAGVGIYHCYRGYQAKFMSNYDLVSMSDRTRKLAMHVGRTGLITRGIAVLIIGGFFVASAWQGGSQGDLANLGDVLATIASQAYGKFLLGVTGFGLMCYGVHSCLNGYFRRFNVNT